MSIEDLRTSFELLKGTEHRKNSLIETLLIRVEQLQADFEKEKLDHARESEFNRLVQLREMQLNEDLRRHKAVMERDAFVLVLIDGDGMIFDDNLIRLGDAGGRQSAGLLWNAVSSCIQANLKLPSDVKIVTRIYANLKGLGEACTKAGVTEKTSLLEDFARGFTGSKQLFDFVDVGMGKDRADDKLSEIFKLHLYDCHCRHIFFGCSHDNGYARVLEDIAEQSIIDSITLLEGVPFERELASLKSKFTTTRFDGLFRSSKLVALQQLPFSSSPPRSNGVPQAGLAPLNSHHQSSYQPIIQRVPSASANGSNGSSNPAPSTWASAAQNAASRVPSPPQPKQTISSTPQVLRNRYNQRLDPVVQCDNNEVKRIKKIKLCNVHFLLNDCPHNPCTHDHSYKATGSELQILRYISRTTPCKYGTECDDPKCIHGHRCPNDTEGKKDCYYGDNCRFDRSMHGVDRTPVRTLKVGGK